MSHITKNLAQIKAKLTENVNLIAVSKTKPIDDIKSAIEAGQLIFGENKVQEAQEKFTILKEQYPKIQLHLIGKLQTNKVKKAVAIADFIHCVDSQKLADEISKEAKKQQKNPQIFIQVNIGDEQQKSGIEIENVENLVKYCQKLDLNLIGLMCIPPANSNPTPYFALLAKIAKENNLQNMSMGMSSDWQDAINFGANYIRVGSAIFGERN